MPGDSSSLFELHPFDESTALLRVSSLTRPRRGMKPSLSRDRLSMSMSHTVTPYFYQRYFYISHGGLVASAFNLASSTLGAGTLALPHAFYNSGLLLGSATLLICCLATVYSVFLLAKVMELAEAVTYEEMAHNLFGPTFEKFTALMIVVFCWGTAVVYIVVAGDIIHPFVTNLGLDKYGGRDVWMVVFWLFIMLPLSLARSINTLRYAALMGNISTMVLVAVICIHAYINGAVVRSEPLVVIRPSTVGSLSTFVFSFGCQPLVPKVFSEMRSATATRLTKSAAWSMGVCTIMYVIAGAFGAADFGDKTRPNILQNYHKEISTPYIAVAYFAMTVAATMAFPITIFPVRDSVLIAMGYTDDHHATPCVSAITAGILALLALLLGILVPNVRVLFDILGGVFGGFVSFLFPAIFTLKCVLLQQDSMGVLHFVGTLLLFALGALTCLLGIYGVFDHYHV